MLNGFLDDFLDDTLNGRNSFGLNAAIGEIVVQYYAEHFEFFGC